MSLETLDLLNEDRKNVIELSPFSETFTISTGGSFFGIFDKSHIEDKADKAGVTQKNLKARIMVAIQPPELTDKENDDLLVTRENGADIYTYSFYGIDDEGLGIVWLY